MKFEMNKLKPIVKERIDLMSPSELGSSDKSRFVRQNVFDLLQGWRFESGKRLGLQMSGRQSRFVVPLLDRRVAKTLQRLVVVRKKLFILTKLQLFVGNLNLKCLK